MHSTKPGSSLFLGIELATDQLRATLVDDNLELMGVECVDFDIEVPEYQYVFPSTICALLFALPFVNVVYTSSAFQDR
jgi:hypothetical protein